VSSKRGEDDEPDPTRAHEGRTPSFSPRPTEEIAGVSPLRWRSVTAKISTWHSPAEIVRHSSYNSSTLPEILPYAPQIFPSLPSHPYFSLLFLIFFFSTSFINKTIKESKISKKITL
jgi:hypothetical protein